MKLVLQPVEAVVKSIIKFYPQVHAYVKMVISLIQVLNANYAQINAKLVVQHQVNAHPAKSIEF